MKRSKGTRPTLAFARRSKLSSRSEAPHAEGLFRLTRVACTPPSDSATRAARASRASARHRDLSRPLLWMHAPSVGEGLQARPVLALMREKHPNVQLAYTHFSPSA